MAATLADPQWFDASEFCPACGYSLAGLTPPMPCPECGLNFTGRQFLVHGVPSARSVMSRSRIAVIILLCVVATFLPQILMAVFLLTSWLVMVAVFSAIGLAVFALVITAPRSQGGRSRFVFVEGGLNVVPLKIDETKGHDPRQGFIRFNGDERATLRPVSTVWAKLTICRPDQTPIFEAGVRCPREQANRMLATIDELIRGREANTSNAPPTS